MKLYISGPMTGIKDYNKPAFDYAALRLSADTYNPAEHIVEGLPWQEYLKHDIQELVKCDGIALLKGWEQSRGASFEWLTAYMLGMNVYLFNENIGIMEMSLGEDRNTQELILLAAQVLFDVIGKNSFRHGGHTEWQSRTPQFHAQKAAGHSIDVCAMLDLHKKPANGEGALEHARNALVRAVMCLKQMGEVK